MMRHTTHLATTLRPRSRRKQARASATDIVRDGRAATNHVATAHDAEVAAMHAAAVSYPARERAAGGPQDRALYRCDCGCAFLGRVEAGAHCPHCDSEQSW
jgi:hypothetical protein